MSYLWAVLSCCLLFMTSCATAQSGNPGNKGYDIAWSGRIQKVHRDGDASPVINLRDIQGPAGLFAMGPLAGLRGEITVMDGKAYIARVVDETVTVSREFEVEAPFLVYGSVRGWRGMDVPEDVMSIKDLERWLDEAAKGAGIDTDTEALPFKIVTSESGVEYHIMSNTEPGYHSTRPHHELMKSFESLSEQVTLVGVFSKSHGGVFTKKGHWTHIHAVGADGSFSGHVDSVGLGPDAVLYLPGD